MRFPICLRITLLLFLVQQPACTRKVAAPLPSPAVVPGPVARLQGDLEKVFSDFRLEQAQVCVEVVSLDRSEVLFAKNSKQLFTPASTNKVITAAVALTRLNPEYRFKTRILRDGPVEEGLLRGNLIIAGSGDPSMSPRFHDGNPFAVFESWAGLLNQSGIQTISGAVIGDDAAFPDAGPGFGWEWNDLPYSYAARPGALLFNDNIVTLELKPGGEKGVPAQLGASPVQNFLEIRNDLFTGEEGTASDIQIEYGEDGENIRVSGTVPAKGAQITQNVAVRHPTQFYLTALRSVLSREGIRANQQPQAVADRSLVFEHVSPPLPEVLKPLLKNSQNLYAETLVRTLGLAIRGEGTFAKGKEVVEETLAAMGISAGSYAFADGSGLSRLNLQSPDSLVRLLQAMRRDRLFPLFYAALPVAGIDGTLSTRMKKTAAENNVRAKTGSMSKVSTIAGYLTTRDGEMLAFCIAINYLLSPREVPESIQDKALERLTQFSRN